MKTQKFAVLGVFVCFLALVFCFLFCGSQQKNVETQSSNLFMEPNVTINSKTLLTKPTAVTSSFTYDGTLHTLEFNNFDEMLMQASNDLEKTNAGEYVAIITLLNTDDYAWDNGSGQPEEGSTTLVAWRIEKQTIQKPTIKNTEFFYTGSAHEVSFDDFDENTMVLSGQYSEINANNYVAVVSLINENNMQWDDETSQALDFSWRIRQRAVNAPILSQTKFVYTGKEISLKDAFKTGTFDEDIMQLDSYGTETNVGLYKARVSLKDPYNYIWANGTSADIPFLWEIVSPTNTLPYIILTLAGTIVAAGVLTLCVFLIDPRRKK